MQDAINFFTTNWVSICAGLWTVDQLLKIIVPLTPMKWDDNLADMFSKLLQRFLPKK